MVGDIMNDTEMIFCTRCGEKMFRNQRNCLKCGQLNYENPNNSYMKRYESESSATDNTYIIGKGSMHKSGKLSIFNNSRPNEMLSNNAGNLMVCVLTNILIYLAGIACSFLISFFASGNVSAALLNNLFISFLISYSLIFILVYSLELLFMKADKPWWGALVPIYNFYLLCKIVLSNGFFLILFFIPVIGIIMLFILFYNIGRSYGKNPWLTLLFGPIALPFLAFSNTTNYNGIVYVNRIKGKDPVEVLYKWNKRVLTLFFIFIISGVCLFIYNKRQWFLDRWGQVMTMSFIKDAKLIVEDLKVSVENDAYTCSNGVPLSSQTEYYIIFQNAGEYFSSSNVAESSLSGEYYRGYVRVVNSENDVDYYISIDDTVFGISEVNFVDLKKTYAKKGVYANPPENVVICSK